MASQIRFNRVSASALMVVTTAERNCSRVHALRAGLGPRRMQWAAASAHEPDSTAAMRLGKSLKRPAGPRL